MSIHTGKLKKLITDLKKAKKIKYPKNFNLIDGKSMYTIEYDIFKAIDKNILPQNYKIINLQIISKKEIQEDSPKDSMANVWFTKNKNIRRNN